MFLMFSKVSHSVFSKVSISTEIDLLITNMILFSQLDASFPVKVAKISKLKKCQMTEYIYIALIDLVYIFRETSGKKKKNA